MTIPADVLSYIMSIEGMISADEAALLYDRAQAATVGIVEIGAFRGRSTIALALGSKAGNRVPVWSIDPHEPESTDGYPYSAEDGAAFLRNIVTAGVESIVKPLFVYSDFMPIPEVVSADLAWIDGNHEAPYPSSDFVAVWACMRKPHILMHDRHAPAVQDAIETARKSELTVTELAGSTVEIQ